MDKALENLTAQQAAAVTASYKQIGVQEALLKSYKELGAVAERSGLQENEYSKLREQVQRQFNTTDVALIAERIAARKAETEINKEELKRNLDLFTQAQDEAARRVAGLRGGLADTPKNAAGIASTTAGQQLVEKLAVAEKYWPKRSANGRSMPRRWLNSRPRPTRPQRMELTPMKKPK
ncbi:MAG: hypothetical protein ACRYFK_12220 [Janthinobacterium lividum]